nr:hypothetical protein [Sinorhizobium meliloti]
MNDLLFHLPQSSPFFASRMLIHVRHGKGIKARYVMLSVELLGILPSYWRLARPGSFLFRGVIPANLSSRQC